MYIVGLAYLLTFINNNRVGIIVSRLAGANSYRNGRREGEAKTHFFTVLKQWVLDVIFRRQIYRRWHLVFFPLYCWGQSSATGTHVEKYFCCMWLSLSPWFAHTLFMWMCVPPSQENNSLRKHFPHGRTNSRTVYLVQFNNILRRHLFSLFRLPW